MIISHEHPEYIKRRGSMNGPGRWNGAFYYSQEIVNNIIPNVKTDRNWITINVPGVACDHSVVFIHNNKTPEAYGWLSKYKDLVLVCGVPETCEKVSGLGKAVYLPLSIDVKEVQQHKGEKTRGAAYVGRPAKRNGINFPPGTDAVEGLPRDKMLDEIARYREVYAVGRCAIEARALGCDILPYDPRYPDPSRWKVIDNLEAAVMLQEILDGIDGRKEEKPKPAKKPAAKKKKGATK